MNYRSKILNQIKISAKRDDAKPITLSAVLLGSILIMFFIFLLPSLKTISNLKSKNQSLHQSLERLQKLENTYSTAAKYFDQIKPEYYELSKKIPNNPNPYYFIDRINLYSVNNSGVLKSMKLIEKESGIEAYEITLYGSYPSIEKFFNDLLADSRFFSVEVLTISQSSDKVTSTNRLSLVARIYAFYKGGLNE